VEIAEHIAALRDAGHLLAAAAERAGPSAPVPSCPGWQVRDLLRHTGYVHRWATEYVVGRHLTYREEPSEEELLESTGPGDDASLPDWFREGHARLVSALEQADPDLKCWTFLRGSPSPLAFWARRQAHETTIHRVDAQLAAGVPVAGLDTFAPGLAADGIDELIMGFGGRASKRGLRSDPPCWLAVHAAGSAGSAGAAGSAGDAADAVEAADSGDWIVRMGADSAEVARGQVPPAHASGAAGGQAPAGGGAGGAALTASSAPGGRPEPGRAGRELAGDGCEITGPPAPLYLLLWNRAGRDGLELTGAARALDTWAEKLCVRW
jgi:uncharacterized protein (TIGR03083 family)